MRKLNKYDVIFYLAVLLIIAAIVLFAYYYFESQVGECTSDPIEYAMKELGDRFKADSIKINIYVDGKPYFWNEKYINEPINYSNLDFNISK